MRAQLMLVSVRHENKFTDALRRAKQNAQADTVRFFLLVGVYR